MNRRTVIAALLGVVALAGCDKNAVQDITGPLPVSSIRFFNFGIGAPQVNFYAGDRKVTAVLSTSGTEAVTGVGFGNVAAAGYYTGVEPGQHTFTGRIAAETDKNLAISSVTTTIEPGKQYSYYQSGVYNTTTKTVDAFIVEDDFPAEIDFDVAYVRLVNAMYNADPMILYIDNDSTAELAIGGPVPYKSAGEFVAVPNGVYTLMTRYPGSATNLITRTNVSLSRGRVYTITTRGDVTVTSSTAANRRFLDVDANR